MGKVQPPSYYDTPRIMRQSPQSFAPPWKRKALAFAARFGPIVAQIDKQATVLDVGCHIGLLAAFLWHAGHRGKYYGIDFAPKALEVARRGNATQAHQNAEFLLVDFSQSPLPDVSPDVVVCTEVLEHMEDDHALLAKFPKGLPTFLEVPSFDAQAHVRRFGSAQEVMDRYGYFFERHDPVKVIKATNRECWYELWGVSK